MSLFCLHSQAERSVSKHLHHLTLPVSPFFCLVFYVTVQYSIGIYTARAGAAYQFRLTLRHYVLQTYTDQTGSEIKTSVSRKIVLWQQATQVFLNNHNSASDVGFFFKTSATGLYTNRANDPYQKLGNDNFFHSVPFHRVSHIYWCQSHTGL